MELLETGTLEEVTLTLDLGAEATGPLLKYLLMLLLVFSVFSRSSSRFLFATLVSISVFVARRYYQCVPAFPFKGSSASLPLAVW